MALRDPVLVAALALAAALRLYGLDHGLPFVYNPDEANIMARALSVARSPDPEYYLYPSFFFYFLFGVMGALFVAGRLSGRYQSLRAFEARFFEDPSDFYLAGRLVGVVAALATVVLTYRLVKKHFGRTAARASSLFLAVCYFHVRDAHYLKHDVPSGLLLVLSFAAIDRALEKKRLGNYLLAGVALGVSFATHYYLIFLAPAFVIAHWAHQGWKRFDHVALGGAVSALTFFLLSPFVVLRLPTAVEHMRANRQVVVDRSLESGSTLLPSLPLYLEFVAEQGLGYLVLALGAVGFVLMAVRAPARLALWGAFPLFFLVFISYTFFAGRYLNPVAPSLAAAAGLAVAGIGERLGSRLATAVALLASIQPLYFAVQVDRLFAGKDTRTLTREWILEHVPPGETVALQSYSVPLPQSEASFRGSLEENDALDELDKRGKYAHLLAVAEAEERAYRLVFFGAGEERNRKYVSYEEVASGLEPLTRLGVAVVVLRHHPIAPAAAVRALFANVQEEATLLETITPFETEEVREPYLDNEDWPPRATLSHKGPRMEIWALEKH